MWLHLMSLAIGDVIVVVATDDDALAATLAPWQATVPSDFDLLQIDFSAELHPPPPAHRSLPRSIPVVHHGTVVLARSTDLDELRDALLRSLGSIAMEVPAGCLRLSGVPLLRDGGIELAALQTGADGSRALRRRGFDPLYSGSVVIDPRALTVQIAAPLGSSVPPVLAPLGRWWSDLPDAIPPWPFGQRVAMTVSRVVSMAPSPVVTSEELAALVSLMETRPPRSSSEPVE